MLRMQLAESVRAETPRVGRSTRANKSKTKTKSKSEAAPEWREPEGKGAECTGAESNTRLVQAPVAPEPCGARQWTSAKPLGCNGFSLSLRRLVQRKPNGKPEKYLVLAFGFQIAV